MSRESDRDRQGQAEVRTASTVFRSLGRRPSLASGSGSGGSSEVSRTTASPIKLRMLGQQQQQQHDSSSNGGNFRSHPVLDSTTMTARTTSPLERERENEPTGQYASYVARSPRPQHSQQPYTPGLPVSASFTGQQQLTSPPLPLPTAPTRRRLGSNASATTSQASTPQISIGARSLAITSPESESQEELAGPSSRSRHHAGSRGSATSASALPHPPAADSGIMKVSPSSFMLSRAERSSSRPEKADRILVDGSSPSTSSSSKQAEGTSHRSTSSSKAPRDGDQAKESGATSATASVSSGSASRVQQIKASSTPRCASALPALGSSTSTSASLNNLPSKGSHPSHPAGTAQIPLSASAATPAPRDLKAPTYVHADTSSPSYGKFSLTKPHWSKPPLWGRLPNRPMRAHTATLVNDGFRQENTIWCFGGCDAKTCYRDVWRLDLGKLAHPLK